ncbi:WxcM-like, C-terminal [Myroides sp. A21]|uniref:WxcM-like domain-containing protein n=1 Tax=Myroides sp. A21 TaxID=1583100 RepID=UPI00057DAE7F|nr:WxcM-like domain-containing protein [Myroides sp. A21]AJA70388.1 WxcM-like, C-terminal [Myroides sp. A21]
MFLKGDKYSDVRGSLTYNNAFDASVIKRIYTIENATTDFVRGWQGHQIEQRWFAAMMGSFEITVIQVDDFTSPSEDLVGEKCVLTSEELSYLHVTSGCITAIQALEENSKLLVLADYGVGEINDEVRFSIDYFKNIVFNTTKK